MKKSGSSIIKIMVWLSFGLYLLALYYLLFMADGRGVWEETNPTEYVAKHMKIVPFETIGAYIRAIIYGHRDPFIPVVNLLGNFVLLMPLGVYLPLLFKKLKKWSGYIVVVLVCILYIEVTQFLFLRGTFDVDDIILNFSGAMFGFLLRKLSLIKRLENAYHGRCKEAQNLGGMNK